MGYRFSVEKFKENFNAKDITDKSIDSVRITHRPDGNFQVFPYKATGKAQAPIVTELETVVSGFFREVLKKKTEPIEYNTLCAKLLEELEIEEEDTDYFKDIRLNKLFKEYELRGICLDNTSREYLQEFFTKLNLIDRKSDSGDAQYVKRIL